MCTFGGWPPQWWIFYIRLIEDGISIQEHIFCSIHMILTLDSLIDLNCPGIYLSKVSKTIT